MTNEEKLLKLLQIAVENGWKSNFIQKIQSPDFIIEECTVYTAPSIDERFFGWEMLFPSKAYSLNDLVTNFEEEEVSFIQALCRATEKIKSSHFKIKDWENSFQTNIDFYFVYEELEFLWNFKLDKENRIDKRPTSQRLDWLFKTFNHLIIAQE